MNIASRIRTVHDVDRHHKHLKWSKKQAPVLTVSSGDVVTFDALDSSNGQITVDSDTSALDSFRLDLADPAFGPVYVRNAEPGDALKIDIIALETGDWGWTAVVPGFGLLADDFADSVLKIWRFDSASGFAELKSGVRVPVRPFLGIMGIAPGADGEFSTIPPTEVGGNIDCRDLVVGSTLYLPVQVAGALFSCGDGHAAQGQGEVCGTAIETPMKATVRLSVCKNHPWVQSPHLLLPPPPPAPFPTVDKGRYATMGLDSDLLEATRKAARFMIDWLVSTKGLTRNEAYILTSVAADLKMAEVVDMPNFAVTMSIPLNIFD
ncbi:acetamidase/formamidase family protein [Talaromyces proteolyticus]|uniref:Acetamidase/formamidase family protein n=1 Tax=Talaromyces proteolyticus TaxID=1131652 RepID=A0AAD4KL11_9EURO|nr:acetamidase/formamidase family protein [Talaromyces proteolyticus]KAH8693754.1 acetamidase/formamidase family protein [Talaromyces proteolyticus]